MLPAVCNNQWCCCWWTAEETRGYSWESCHKNTDWKTLLQYLFLGITMLSRRETRPWRMTLTVTVAVLCLVVCQIALVECRELNGQMIKCPDRDGKSWRSGGNGICPVNSRCSQLVKVFTSVKMNKKVRDNAPTWPVYANVKKYPNHEELTMAAITYVVVKAQ